MSVETYFLLPIPFAKLVPASLGLGADGLFAWPDADRHEGWEYPRATVRFTLLRPRELPRSFDVKLVAPGPVGSAMEFLPYWYVQGIEHTFALALGGFVVTDAEMNSDLYDEDRDDEDEDDEDDEPELELAPGYKGRHMDARNWKKSFPDSAMQARAYLYADRFAPTAKRFATVRDLAIRGNKEAQHLLGYWADRASAARVNPSRKADLTVIREGMTPALRKLVTGKKLTALRPFLTEA